MFSKAKCCSVFKASTLCHGHVDLNTSWHRKFVLHHLNEGPHHFPNFHIPLAPRHSPQTPSSTQTDAETNTELFLKDLVLHGEVVQQSLKPEFDFQDSYSERKLYRLSTAFHTLCGTCVDICVGTHKWVNAIFKNRKEWQDSLADKNACCQPDGLSSILEPTW